MATRTGKIARLPHSLREEINRRLLDGETSGTLLAWLNAEPEAVRIWEAHFEGVPASAENLSQWRMGGYRDWIGRNEKSEHLKTLTSFAVKVAKSGGSIADGAAAIIAGNILEALETVGNLVVTGGSDDAEKDPLEGLCSVANAVGSLQKGAAARGRLELDKKKVRLKEQAQQLDREKFESQTVSKFLEWARTPEAAAILDSGKSKEVVMADLRQLLFGTGHPNPNPAAP
jgi:hypothetical protein